jgi:hypothetical protein
MTRFLDTLPGDVSPGFAKKIPGVPEAKTAGDEVFLA